MKLPEKIMLRLLPVLMAVILAAGCGTTSGQTQSGNTETADIDAAETEEIGTETPQTGDANTDVVETDDAKTGVIGADGAAADTLADQVKEAAAAAISETEAVSIGLPVPGLPEAFDLSMVPEFDGTVWADVNEDVPFFDEKEMEAARLMAKVLSQENTEKEAGETADDVPQSPEKAAEHSYQLYGQLDGLGRCTGACALVGPETLPQEERGNIGMVKPTGWHTAKYDGIDGNYLYNRCHLIGFQLTGQDANDRNLITGTRFMNVEGMLPYEDSVLAYVRGTGNHVLYRVTPVFQGKNLLADGVLMEARSVEDPLVQFCAFCYNVQPGITIDYATGESSGPEFTGSDSPERIVDNGTVQNGTGDAQAGSDSGGNVPEKSNVGNWKYIVNVNSMKFHRPDCESVQKMSKKNMQGFNGTREELIEAGYTPCKNCNP